VKKLTLFQRAQRAIGCLVTLAALFGGVQPSYADTPQPHVWASATDNSIYVGDFTPNASLVLTVYDGGGSVPLLGPLSVETDGDGHGEWKSPWWRSEAGFFDLQVGHRVVVHDPVALATRELTLVWVTFDLLDIDNDVARGTARPNASVMVGVGPHPSEHGAWVETVAGDDGQ